MRLSFVGCGSITEYHLAALKAAGFEPHYCAARLQSKSCIDFSKTSGLDLFDGDAIDLLRENPSDAYFVAVPSCNYKKLIPHIISTDKPALIEKPAAHSAIELKDYLGYKNIAVGFNRRFYKVVDKVRNEVAKISDHNITYAKVVIPETSRESAVCKKAQDRLLPYYVYDNSCHIIDLISYMFGKIEVINASYISSDNRYIRVAAETPELKFIDIDLMIDASENFSIELYLKGTRKIVMSPIESLKYIEGMEVSEPNAEKPIRTYSPKSTYSFFESVDDGHKPGFLAQANEFYSFSKFGKRGRLASLEDAFNSLSFIDTVESLLHS